MRSFMACGCGEWRIWSAVSGKKRLLHTGHHGEDAHCCLCRNALVGSHP